MYRIPYYFSIKSDVLSQKDISELKQGLPSFWDTFYSLNFLLNKTVIAVLLGLAFGVGLINYKEVNIWAVLGSLFFLVGGYCEKLFFNKPPSATLRFGGFSFIPLTLLFCIFAYISLTNKHFLSVSQLLGISFVAVITLEHYGSTVLLPLIRLKEFQYALEPLSSEYLDKFSKLSQQYPEILAYHKKIELKPRDLVNGDYEAARNFETFKKSLIG